MLWGSKLGLDSLFWRKLNIANLYFLTALAVLPLFIYSVFNESTWAIYKLFLQPFALLTVPLFYARKLLTTTKI
ncbi:hypothetical protein [Alteromonas sp. KUL49]|uniref:hypothetical protein n=1 Tax=Alteromonas sp. KUL49 TaxID=2480798 RepID=UPI00102F1F26|nr:hypothetical protein EYS00_07435 [Alteromonas sp. KUL49]